MFNHEIDLVLRESLSFLFLMLLLLLVLEAKRAGAGKSESEKREKLRRRTATSTVSPSRGVLAQLVRAPPCHGGGCGFEPRRLRIVAGCESVS